MKPCSHDTYKRPLSFQLRIPAQFQPLHRLIVLWLVLHAALVFFLFACNKPYCQHFLNELLCIILMLFVFLDGWSSLVLSFSSSGIQNGPCHPPWNFYSQYWSQGNLVLLFFFFFSSLLVSPHNILSCSQQLIHLFSFYHDYWMVKHEKTITIIPEQGVQRINTVI